MQNTLNTLRESEISKLLMTPEQYSQISHEKPYVFEIHKGGSSLCFYGSKHSIDPNDPMFSDIDSRLLTAKPKIILVGDAKPKSAEKTATLESEILSESKDETIHKRGDVGYMIRLALENNIAWLPLEPTESHLLDYLIDSGFDRDEVFAFRCMQSVIQYQSVSEKPDIQRFMQHVPESLQQATGWDGFDYSLEHFVQIVNRIYRRDFTLEMLATTEDLKSYAYPNSKPPGWNEKSVLNKVWEAAWKFRDIHAISLIVENLKENEVVFVLYGASHAVVQEPVLRELFK